MSKLPPPPVPEKLREMLKDYPELIQELQDALNSFTKNPKPLQPFDEAIWLLKDMLGAFYSEAGVKLRSAENSGNEQAIQKAKEKEFAIGYARGNMGAMNDLWAYFEAHGGV
ncbi:hypothetical protein HDE76_000514 [Rhodanobacter sp. ANJX3]|uniref:hypothetical protein n=1 Tax=unclassified Rhodanobacter TaxID=2621553 RepID=UPI0017E9DB27|nr:MULTISPECIES: hypothetical protein [unclassified Rhodanobacter]MBB5357332.1 hypothetical protein [Rhodanobacter sp. ANJX3]NYE27385.1 hypothetical protein [Rhodanobacter sp. K2T2]